MQKSTSRMSDFFERQVDMEATVTRNPEGYEVDGVMVEHNHRGYALEGFARSYDRTCTWDWLAAALQYGIIDNKQDYVARCMKLYDSFMVGRDPQDIDAVTELTFEITNEVRQWVQSSFPGWLGRQMQEDGARLIVPRHSYSLDAPTDPDGDPLSTHGSMLSSVEPGYAELEDDEVMAQRLTLLKEATHPDDYKALLLIVEGHAKTWNAACRQLGYSDGSTHFRRRRMKEAVAELKGLEAFAQA